MPPPHLPPEVCRDIFILLPAKSLLQFRAVCKAWRSVIEDPFFVKAHIDKQLSSRTIIIRASTGPPFSPLYSFDLDALNFTDGLQTISATPLAFTRRSLANLRALPVAACNGLMLIAPLYSEGILEIWNPLTHERLKLPQRGNSPNSRIVGIGLGFDCAADDYKVVVIDYQHNNDNRNPQSTSQIYVYSLKLDSWRNVGSCPVEFDDGNGVFLNGSLYWVSFGVVFVFDVVTENYRQLALPVLKRSVYKKNLNSLHGRLFLSCICDSLSQTTSFDVWVMNEDGGNDLWMKLFKLEKANVHSQFDFRDLRLVAFVKNKSLVFLQHNLAFLLFDFERNSIKNVSIHGFSKLSAQTCVGSLFRLHDSCGRVASKRRTRKGTMKTTYTKLTFCVKEGSRRYHSSHDYCYTLNSNSYNSSCESDEICGVTLNPEVDTSSHSITLDICREIFLYLPPKSLVRFRAISKAHCAIIDDQFFVRSHTNRQLESNNTVIIRNSTGPPFNPFYSFNLDDLNFTDIVQTIVVTPLDFPHRELSFIPSLPTATCNGLILVACRKNWEIWNPSTDERLELPQGDFPFNPKAMDIGLGYDFATNDYKAVVIDHRQRRREKEVYRINVYSLKLDSWSEMIMNFPFPCGPSVFVCGSLNWLSTPGREKQVIIALDLGTENYRQLQLPPLPETRRTCYGPKLYLDVLGGCLILNYFGFEDSEYNHLDVWVMKVYGDEDSWVKLFSINEKIRNVYDPKSDLRVVAYMRNKTQFLLQDGSRGFFLFDVESNYMKKVGIHGLTGNLSAQIIPGSIFRLHDNCGVGGIRTTRIIKRESRMFSDTELNFCVTDYLSRDSHDNCYSLDSNCCYSSGEDEDSS